MSDKRYEQCDTLTADDWYGAYVVSNDAPRQAPTIGINTNHATCQNSNTWRSRNFDKR